MRTRGAGEVRQAPRENQQQRPEFRYEKGGHQQTMPVSFLLSVPARAISLSGKRPLLFAVFTCSMRGSTSVRVTLTFRFVENSVTVFCLFFLVFLFHFLPAPREIFRHEKNARSFLSLVALRINFQNVRETRAVAELSAELNRANCDVGERNTRRYIIKKCLPHLAIS